MKPRDFITGFSENLSKKSKFKENAELVGRVTEICASGIFAHDDDSALLLFYAQECYKIFPHGELDPRTFEPDAKIRNLMIEHQTANERDNTRKALQYLEAMNVMVDAIYKRREKESNGVRIFDAALDAMIRRCRNPYHNGL